MANRISLFVACLLLAVPLSGCEDVTSFVDATLGPSVSAAASFEVTQDQPALLAHFHGTVLKNAQADDSANEIALTLDGPADAQMFANLQRRAPDWIRGTHVDGNIAIIVARDNAAFSTSAEENGFLLTIAPRIAPLRAALSDTPDAETPVAAPVEPIRIATEPLRGDQDSKIGAAQAGLQHDDLRAAYGN